MRLFDDPIPPTMPGIDLRCCSCEDLPAEADLVIADPPWSYTGTPGLAGSTPEDHYDGLPTGTIAAHLRRFVAPRLALWLTWPLMAEWRVAWTEGETTGGAWLKSDPGDSGHYGQGYHWAGCSEPVLVYSRGGGYLDRSVPVRNAWHDAPGLHSRKPARWMAQWIRRWCPPGGLVIDPYAGLGAVAEAVLVAGEGRRYIGAEIDPERHRGALSLVAQAAGRVDLARRVG